ncbi:hypothetical protein BV20DRAFT_1058096 [Pilatotrama ljubarskyi]|nr:hypothetical protein BV20DRAFT_1058096 [Pilatotrama ljubarskyi]
MSPLKQIHSPRHTPGLPALQSRLAMPSMLPMYVLARTDVEPTSSLRGFLQDQSNPHEPQRAPRDTNQTLSDAIRAVMTGMAILERRDAEMPPPLVYAALLSSILIAFAFASGSFQPMELCSDETAARFSGSINVFWFSTSILNLLSALNRPTVKQRLRERDDDLVPLGVLQRLRLVHLRRLDVFARLHVAATGTVIPIVLQ